jgi:hypothetical protein
MDMSEVSVTSCGTVAVGEQEFLWVIKGWEHPDFGVIALGTPWGTVETEFHWADDAQGYNIAMILAMDAIFNLPREVENTELDFF